MSELPLCPVVPEGKTIIIHPEKDEDLIFPASLLARGELVAFPTETVYGLGASATDVDAVAKIFTAKGRPADNPLIVHVARKADIQELVLEVTPLAECLMDAFMPGPVTLVMKKSARIPDLVSAGLKTVGIRMPSHPIAQKLILLSGVAVAAPSANVSGSPSPTRAEHVEKDLAGKIPCIVDGGPCEVGLESTVVDVTGSWPVILRPGAVTIEMIVDACRKAGIPAPGDTVETRDHAKDDETPRAPGMKYRHYAPRALVSAVMPRENKRADAFLEKAMVALAVGDRETIGVFCGNEESDFLKDKLPAKYLARVFFYIFGENTDIDGAARGLFDGIRSLDNAGVALILAAGFIGNGLETAYMNRLEKAAGEKKELDPLDNSAALVPLSVLFVCTGNTCRSPIAEAIFNVLASRRGPFLKIGNPKTKALIHGSSAGIFADNGSPAAEHAVEAVRSLFGADLSGHKSRKATEEIIAGSDMVFAVTSEHAAILRRLFSSHSRNIYSFSEYFVKKSISMPDNGTAAHMPDVPDPFGQHSEVYVETARFLYDAIESMWQSILADLGIKEIDSI